MALHQNVSGTWKSNVKAHINVAGTWKLATVWKNVAGTWKRITGVSLPASMYASSTAATASISLNSSGAWSETIGGSGTWLNGGVNSDYEARVSNVVGTTLTGTVNTWLALSSTRTWSLTSTASVAKYTTFTLEIRMAAAPNTVLATSSCTIDAQSTL